MPQELPSDTEVEGWLKALGLRSLCQWDVLVFLSRHQATLVGAEYVAELLGYAAEPVVIALDELESLGFVVRSRVSQGARLYQFTVPAMPSHGKTFERLLALASHRAGRLLLSEQLRRRGRPPEERLEAAGRILEQDPQVIGAARLPSRHRKERSESWRKAI